MLDRGSKHSSRQSPLDKAAKFGENAIRVISTAKGIYDAGRAAWGAAQAVAPYAQAALSML